MINRKILFIIFFCVSVLSYSQSRYYVAPWVQKFFLNFNLLYDYEKLSTDNVFDIESNNMLFEFVFGYDFERIAPKIFIDIGLPLLGVVGFSNGDQSLTEVMDTSKIKFGFEVGIKFVKTQKVDLVLPLGILFSWTTYTQKNPSYVSGHPYDRIWDYYYMNLFSGISAIFKLNEHFKLGVFSRIGFSIKKEYEYKEILRGNFIWSDNNSNTHSIKRNVDVLNFSIGIGVLANL